MYGIMQYNDANETYAYSLQIAIISSILVHSILLNVLVDPLNDLVAL